MRVLLKAMIAMGVLLPGSAFAQTIPGDVTFEVPLNLTRLPGDITKVAVGCSIESEAVQGGRMIRGKFIPQILATQVEFPVTAGRVVTTASIVVSIPPGTLVDPIGKSATYRCTIMAYSIGSGASRTSAGLPAAWGLFDEKDPNPSFHLSPTPQPITGKFAW